MTVWPRHIVFFDARDEYHVEEAVELAGRLRVHYVPAAAPTVYLRFVNDADAMIFKMAYPYATLNRNNTAKLANVASLASISQTLGQLSLATQVEHVWKAALWCRDQAAEKAFNAALKGLSGRFVGPLPTI